MTLTKGNRYNLAILTCTGWINPQGSDLAGYQFEPYFSEDGTYKGADEHGVEPEVESEDSTCEFLTESSEMEECLPTEYREALKREVKILGIIQQYGAVDAEEALKAAKAKWGSEAEFRSEGDDIDGGCQWLVISQA